VPNYGSVIRHELAPHTPHQDRRHPGPRHSEEATIRALFEAGVDVFRLNFSHGTQADQRARGSRPCAASSGRRPPDRRADRPAGAEAAHRDVRRRRIALVEGQSFRLQLDPMTGTASGVQLPHREIFDALRTGDSVLIDDGKVRLARRRWARGMPRPIVESGRRHLGPQGRSTCPTACSTYPPETRRTCPILQYALDMEVDWVALSFVQTPEDVRHAKNDHRRPRRRDGKNRAAHGARHAAGDRRSLHGIMVARGDLGWSSRRNAARRSRSASATHSAKPASR